MKLTSAEAVTGIIAGAVLILAALAALVARYLAKRGYALNLTLKPATPAPPPVRPAAEKPAVFPSVPERRSA